MQNNVICKEKKQGFVARTKAKFNALAKNKKGVSQMVELLIIIGIIAGAAVGVGIWITSYIHNKEKDIDPNASDKEPATPANPS